MIKSPEKEIDMILEKNENFVINESMIPPEMSVTIDNARELAREFKKSQDEISCGDKRDKHQARGP